MVAAIREAATGGAATNQFYQMMEARTQLNKGRMRLKNLIFSTNFPL